ncbi:MAG: phosphate/phosphite/phosphonate ABC transporter substrate-binding protein [Chloroflexota bacterium]
MKRYPRGRGSWWANHASKPEEYRAGSFLIKQPWLRKILTVTGAIAIGLSVAGCDSTSAGVAQPVILLSELQPLPTPVVSGIIPLRVSVAAVISPRGTADSYQPLLDYLSRKLERPVELVQRRTYSETNSLLEEGEVDIAFVCTSAYISGHDQFDMRLLVAPQVKGLTTYQSVLIVPAASTAQSIADLRGKVFAFTDPTSNSGRIYPTHLVQLIGSSPESFFARTFFTYNHDDAIRAVATGLADGAAVDSLVYEYALERDPSLAAKVRVIHSSPPFGIPPVVVGPKTPPQVAARISEILLGMNTDPAGQRVLQHLGVDAFVQVGDQMYNSVRELVTDVGPLTP